MNKPEEIKKIVKEKYAQIATQNSGCCSCSNKNNEKISKEIGYSQEDLLSANNANLGLGCGNPVALSKIKEGDVVLDLGCGAGFDCFLAAKKAGTSGKVIGLDMTKEMIKKARENAEKLGAKNVEFILGEIENMPIRDDSVDVIITNCVINLTPDKAKSFREAYRVLKKGGRIYLSDIVLLENLSEEQRNNKDLLCGCVAGALLKEDYIEKIQEAGFKVNILLENKEIGKQQYRGINLESISIEAIK